MISPKTTSLYSPAENAVLSLVSYAIRCGLICPEEAVFAANSLLDVLQLEPSGTFSAAVLSDAASEERPEDAGTELEGILSCLLDDAVSRGVIDGGIASRDLFDTKLMGCVTPRPGEFLRNFREKYQESPQAATDYFYQISCDSDYIRRYRVRRDMKWLAPTPYGDLDITINLSKPEKDPKAIAAALTKKQDSYPKCLLCHENEGYAGHLTHPARQTLRQVPMTLDGESWYLQYSPYVYYNEHCIALSSAHVPMKIDRHTFARLMDFLKLFPHYTIGSNADLPIVGGSILTHEHFQGGNYTFAMAKAPVREAVSFPGFADVTAGIVHWPMSVIRLDGANPDRLVELADRILTAWRGYSDPSADILAETDGTPHNTITPIARMRDGLYELDLVLRNNRTTEEFPLGIFHPHQELHHIKKENIGLIEVMGLAVLPARLKGEMASLREAILNGADLRADAALAPHADWAEEWISRHPELSADNLEQIIQNEIGLVFSRVLEDAGVYKDTPAGREAFLAFVQSI